MNFNGIALIGFLYIFLLFVIAYIGDRLALRNANTSNSNLVYALSLAVYCSSWTFYGAVGTASTIGIDYLAIYLGPILVFLFGYPLVKRIILISRQYKITTISDFLSSRFGKSRGIAVLVTIIAVTGSLPYIALQLKAVASSYIVISGSGRELTESINLAPEVGFVIAASMVVFTILFGTRQLDATEHHQGMMLAVAFESVVKLAAILAVGYYAIYLLLNSSAEMNLGEIVRSSRPVLEENGSTGISFITKLILAASAIVLLPRQFQVTVVESRDQNQFNTAIWVMPVYLVITSLVVIPIALSGMVLLPNAPEDLYVLLLPLMSDNQTLATVAFIGGLSAATGMVMVAAISLSTMLCNDLVMPVLIKRHGIEFLQRSDINSIILRIRRFAIVGLMLGAYFYFLLIDTNAQLANIGLISFAAVVQFLPGILSALFWKNAHSKGVYWGLVGGFLVWGYALLIPTILPVGWLALMFGESGILHPQGFFGLSLDNSLTHGVFWSLLVNTVLLVVFSLREPLSVFEKLQASRFFRASIDHPTSQHADLTTVVTPDALFVLAERIIGKRNAKALFSQYEKKHQTDLDTLDQVDQELISNIQNALAGVIGTASAQRLISETLLANEDFIDTSTHLVEETSSVLRFNRNVLQTALENISQGIAVVDADLNLVVWNENYRKLFDYPKSLLYIGKPVKEILEFSAQRGDFANKQASEEIRKRLNYMTQGSPYQGTRTLPSGRVVKAIGEPLPGNGFVTTYEDITESIQASEMLRRANEELEDRVRSRTEALEQLTKELESTTRSKTHFLAAASHDLLQPINAARLFAHTISENNDNKQEVKKLSQNIDQSLVTANDLLRKLLNISKLDAGGIQPEPTHFSLPEFFAGLLAELQASADEKQVRLIAEPIDLYLYTDKQLLHSVLQNLISNGLRYTNPGGEVRLTASIKQDTVLLKVADTGIGIAQENLEQIFTEFFQIKDDQRRHAKGVGLGLSIVQRISKMLELDINIESAPGVGTQCSLSVARGQAEGSKDEPQLTLFTGEAGSLQNLNIMVLDNDEHVLNAMLTTLKNWGCRVSAHLDFASAKRQLEKHNFDVVIADYQLDDTQTGMDFLLHCTEFAGQQDINQPHCILVTAEQDASIRKTALANDFSFLEKPVEPLTLKTLLSYLLGQNDYATKVEW